jgi:hypothetical protein
MNVWSGVNYWNADDDGDVIKSQGPMNVSSTFSIFSKLYDLLYFLVLPLPSYPPILSVSFLTSFLLISQAIFQFKKNWSIENGLNV